MVRSVSINQLEQEIVINNTEMIIIDSLASIVRREFIGSDVSTLHERSMFLSKISNRLKLISQTLNVSVILSNQILIGGEDDENAAVPALGSTWSHFINTRFILQFVDNQKREVSINIQIFYFMLVIYHILLIHLSY